MGDITLFVFLIEVDIGRHIDQLHNKININPVLALV